MRVLSGLGQILDGRCARWSSVVIFRPQITKQAASQANSLKLPPRIRTRIFRLLLHLPWGLGHQLLKAQGPKAGAWKRTKINSLPGQCETTIHAQQVTTQQTPRQSRISPVIRPSVALFGLHLMCSKIKLKGGQRRAGWVGCPSAAV
jgi:hypothetical protein